MRCSSTIRPVVGQRVRISSAMAPRRGSTCSAYASYSSDETPGRPSAWSRTVPLKSTTAPQSGRTAHSYAAAMGSASSVRAIQSSPVAGACIAAMVRQAALLPAVNRGRPKNFAMLQYALGTVEPDDELDDDRPAPGWVDPDDRLWRHPSEVGETPWPGSLAGSPLAGLRPRREPGLWTVAALAGLIGALLASGVLAATGQLRRNNTIINRPLEQVVLPASNLTGAGTIVTAANTTGS